MSMTHEQGPSAWHGAWSTERERGRHAPHASPASLPLPSPALQAEVFVGRPWEQRSPVEVHIALEQWLGERPKAAGWDVER